MVSSDLTKINGLASREQKLKNSRFYEKRFLITLDSVKTRQSFCQHRAPFVKTRRTKHDLTLKGHVENYELNLCQGHDLIGKRDVLLSRSVSSS